MMERPRQAEYSKHSYDYIFNRARDSGESGHLYAEEPTTPEEHLFYQLKKRDNNKQNELKQHREQQCVEEKSDRRVMNHTQEHILQGRGKKTAPAI